MIRQVLQLHLDGMSNRKIAACLSMNKETVNRYVSCAKSDRMSLSDLLKLDEEQLKHRLCGGSPAYTDERFARFRELLPMLEEAMQNRHVTLTLLWEEYIRDNPGGYGLTQFRHHYNQNATIKRKVSTVLNDLYVGGEKLFVDFAGDTLSYVDMTTGEIIKVQVFVATLPFSDYGFALAVPSQKSEDFIYAVIQCLHHLGGVPKILVPDNLKSAVIKTDRFEPKINDVLMDMANHYGCAVLPTRPASPKDKSLVEDQVKLVYRRVYAVLRNERFYSIEALNQRIAALMLAHNQKRMQKRPYTREEEFLACERPALKPLPATDFEIISSRELTVQDNGFVEFGRDNLRHYYSVPYAYTGQKVLLKYTRSMVRIYSKKHELIATHQRCFDARHRYVYVEDHLASHAKAYRELSPAYFSKAGWIAMPVLGQVIDRLFETSNQPPEVSYKACRGLLSLYKTTDHDLFTLACETALKYKQYSYRFVVRLIETKCGGVNEQLQLFGEHDMFPATHENIRGEGAFK